MNEEEKKAAEAAEAEFQKNLEGLSDEEKAQKIEERASSSLKDTELDQFLEAEKTKTKAKERFEEKKGDLESEEDKPLTKKELTKLLSDRDDQIRKETREEQANDIAKELSESPKEAELILTVWKNRRLAGTLREQLNEARAIAISKRLNAKNNELLRALAGKESIETSGENAQRKPVPKEAPSLNPTDKTVLAGFVWDNAKRAYRKTIAGGRKILFVASDMKKRWTENAPTK